jgi:UDP-N-acetylglucosamine 2-epimerase (non-hydrolysing)
MNEPNEMNQMNQMNQTDQTDAMNAVNQTNEMNQINQTNQMNQMNQMNKVSLIFGTRPEAIKLSPLILALRSHPAFRVEVCTTGQHREMLDQVLKAFSIVPDMDLGLMEPDQSLGPLASRTLAALDTYFTSSEPHLVLVQGDTTTTFCAALAAFYHRIPVGHVEAGLRTWRKDSPFPEEMNRVLTTRLADYHFAPTEVARQNLLQEGVPPERIFVTGNTVIDALLMTAKRIRDHPLAIPGLPAKWYNSSNPLVLITGHRRESFGSGFQAICRAIADLAEKFPTTAFVYPVHLNPNVREPVFSLLGGRPNVFLLDPLEYLPFVALMDRSTLTLTDSGGIQEEAPSLGKPVLVMREVTERPEAVAAGTALLVGTNSKRIYQAVSRLLTDPEARKAMVAARNPYGDGMACQRIVEALEFTYPQWTKGTQQTKGTKQTRSTKGTIGTRPTK